MTKNVKLFRVTTTAWCEEDFYLLTSLTIQQIKEVIEPLVLAEREVVNGDMMYTNNDYIYLLKKHYPSETIIHYAIDGVDAIMI
jgi:hypothetical protein